MIRKQRALRARPMVAIQTSRNSRDWNTCIRNSGPASIEGQFAVARSQPSNTSTERRRNRGSSPGRGAASISVTLTSPPLRCNPGDRSRALSYCWSQAAAGELGDIGEPYSAQHSQHQRGQQHDQPPRRPSPVLWRLRIRQDADIGSVESLLLAHLTRPNQERLIDRPGCVSLPLELAQLDEGEVGIHLLALEPIEA